RHARIIGGYLATIAFDVARGNREELIGDQRYRSMTLEGARANLWPREIDQYGQRATRFFSGRARLANVVRFFILRAVSPVNAHTVNAGGQHGVNHRLLASGRTQGVTYL